MLLKFVAKNVIMSHFFAKCRKKRHHYIEVKTQLIDNTTLTSSLKSVTKKLKYVVKNDIKKTIKKDGFTPYFLA